MSCGFRELGHQLCEYGDKASATALTSQMLPPTYEQPSVGWQQLGLQARSSDKNSVFVILRDTAVEKLVILKIAANGPTYLQVGYENPAEEYRLRSPSLYSVCNALRVSLTFFVFWVSATKRRLV